MSRRGSELDIVTLEEVAAATTTQKVRSGNEVVGKVLSSQGRVHAYYYRCFEAALAGEISYGQMFNKKSISPGKPQITKKNHFYEFLHVLFR